MTKPMKPTGIFITLEGIDGCGKSTQARLLTQALRKMGHEVVLTREPGGTALGRRLRKIVLHTTSKVYPQAEQFLYLADRAQHVEEVILPALAAGKIVVSERFTDSTIAYQGAGRGLPREQLVGLNQISTGGLQPTLTILFDISPAAARERRESNGHSADRFERLEDAFHKRLAREYRRLASEEPARIKTVKASGTVQDVHEKVMNILYAEEIVHHH
jgi:dTMP kinase